MNVSTLAQTQVSWQTQHNTENNEGCEKTSELQVATNILRRFWGRVTDTGSKIL